MFLCSLACLPIIVAMIAMMAAKVMTIIVTMMLAVMETGGNDVVDDGNGTQSTMAMTMAMVVTMVAMISTKPS